MASVQTDAANDLLARQAEAALGRQAQGIANESGLLDVNQVAALLGCSPRHVYRLVDAGKMPQPVRLGALVRWSRASLSEWIAGGCKAVRP